MNALSKRATVSGMTLFASTLALMSPIHANDATAQAERDAIVLSANETDYRGGSSPGGAASGFEKQSPQTDDSGRPGTDATRPTSSDTSQLVSSYQELKTGSAIRGGAIIGKKVIGASGEDLGKVVEIAVLPDGNISSVVVSIGGFMGVGDRLTVLPWEALEISPSSDDIKTRFSKTDLAHAPLFDEVSDQGLKLELKEPKN